MSFSIQETKEWLGKNKWPVAFVVAVVFGYTVGKDLAFRDNRADQVTAAGEVS